MREPDWDAMSSLALNDVQQLKVKGKMYGNSWKKRGGVGAFMVMARKWDRIENICEGHGYSIFSAMTENEGDIADDIDDLIRYLMLIREECDGISNT